MNPCYRTLLTGVVLLLTGSPVAFAGTIEAINHTKWAINHFSVNGQSGLDAIGPFQGRRRMLLQRTAVMETRHDRQDRLGNRSG